MACRRDFWRNSLRSLHMLRKHFEDRTREEFFEYRCIIFNSIDFQPCDHKGPLKPMYYTHGVPSEYWVCKACHEITL